MTSRTIINYCLVEDYDSEELAGIVRRLMSAGWQPFGGVAATRIAIGDTFGNYQYIQAMVMYAKESTQ